MTDGYKTPCKPFAKHRTRPHWIENGYLKTYLGKYLAILSCSECNGLVYVPRGQHYMYCPHCGALMDGKEEEK